MTASLVEFNSAVHVLEAFSIKERTADFINADRRDINWEELLDHAETFSNGERVLVQVALDLWTAVPHDGAGIADLIRWLDNENLLRVLEAVRIRKGLLGEMAA